MVEKLYESGGRIVADFDAIAFDLRTDAGKVKSVATKFGLFYLSGRQLASKSVDRRLQERRERQETARQNGLASGRARKAKGTTVEQPLNDCSTDPQLERKERKERKEITAAPSAADLEKLVGDKSTEAALMPGDDELLEMRLPFNFGDALKGLRIQDLDPVSAQKILDRHKNMGFNLERALRLRVRQKLEESNVTKR